MDYTDFHTWFCAGHYIPHEHDTIWQMNTSSALWWSNKWPHKALTGNFSRRCISWIIKVWKSSWWKKQDALQILLPGLWNDFHRHQQDHIAMEGASNNTTLTDTFCFYIAAYKINFCTSSYRDIPQVRSNGFEARQNPNHMHQIWRIKTEKAKSQLKSLIPSKNFFLHSLSHTQVHQVSYIN